MRKRLVLLALALVASSAVVVTAQPNKKPPAAAKPEDRAAKADSEKKAEADKAPASEAPAPSGGSDDLGAPPPKEAAEQKAETKPSPLTPAPSEFPSGVAKPPPFEYDKLLGDIATLRSRVAALTTTLFASKLRVVVETRGDDARLASFNITLDDGVVFAAPERFSVVVPENKLVDTHLTVSDDSDMAEDFPDDADGEYDLRVKLRARVVE